MSYACLWYEETTNLTRISVPKVGYGPSLVENLFLGRIHGGPLTVYTLDKGSPAKTNDVLGNGIFSWEGLASTMIAVGHFANLTRRNVPCKSHPVRPSAERGMVTCKHGRETFPSVNPGA